MPKEKNKSQSPPVAAGKQSPSDNPVQSRPLIGMKACATDKRDGKLGICDYIGYSEATVLSWIRTRNFPARKLGNKWVSTTDEVFLFLKRYVSGE